MVTTAFAEANGFDVGDVFHANINGQRRRADDHRHGDEPRSSSTRSVPAR